MFNSYNVSNPQTVNINAVSGTIVKNYKDSFILRFHMNSEMADTILDINPRLRVGAYRDNKYKPIVVLQVMLCGEQELLAEVMWKEDFDKLYGQPTVDSIIIPEGATREQVFEVVFGIGMMMAGLKNMDWWRATYKAESETAE